MQTIQELLQRIRWDAEFGSADFQIGYYDRLKQDVILIPLKAMGFSSDDHYNFQCLDENGEQHSVPLHRIKQVYRNGELIWHREH